MSSKHSANSRLLGPRHWPSWLLLGVLKLLVLLPYPVLMRLGDRLGRHILSRITPYRRQIVDTNLSLCFPEQTASERSLIRQDVMGAMGMSFMEMALCWWGDESKLKGLAQIDGIENLESALARGRGVILLTGHFSAFEIAGRLLTARVPLSITYREFRNPLFHRVMKNSRHARFKVALDRSDLRGLIRTLKANEVVWYAPDQDLGRKHNVFADFFGIPASTLTTTSRLAKITGAAIVPFVVKRLPGAQGYHLLIQPQLENFPGTDPEYDSARFNQWLEGEIRKAPEQYLWVHRRFKTRPEGEPPLYPPKPRRARLKKRQQSKSNNDG